MKYRYILFASFLLSAIFLTGTFSDNTILTLRLVHPDHDRITFLPPSEVKIDKKSYEYYKLDNDNYWVSKKIELDITDMKDAKIEVHTPPSKEEIKDLSKREPNTVISLEPSYNITIILNEIGQKKLMKLTANNKMRRLALIFEGHLLIAPMIMDEINTNSFTVSGAGLSDYDQIQRIQKTIKEYSAKSEQRKP